ncbi:unnamed protein product [Ectocarpus fasciculatus]
MTIHSEASCEYVQQVTAVETFRSQVCHRGWGESGRCRLHGVLISACCQIYLCVIAGQHGRSRVDEAVAFVPKQKTPNCHHRPRYSNRSATPRGSELQLQQSFPQHPVLSYSKYPLQQQYHLLLGTTYVLYYGGWTLIQHPQTCASHHIAVLVFTSSVQQASLLRAE